MKSADATARLVLKLSGYAGIASFNTHDKFTSAFTAVLAPRIITTLANQISSFSCCCIILETGGIWLREALDVTHFCAGRRMTGWHGHSCLCQYSCSSMEDCDDWHRQKCPCHPAPRARIKNDFRVYARGAAAAGLPRLFLAVIFGATGGRALPGAGLGKAACAISPLSEWSGAWRSRRLSRRGVRCRACRL